MAGIRVETRTYTDDSEVPCIVFDDDEAVSVGDARALAELADHDVEAYDHVMDQVRLLLDRTVWQRFEA